MKTLPGYSSFRRKTVFNKRNFQNCCNTMVNQSLTKMLILNAILKYTNTKHGQIAAALFSDELSDDEKGRIAAKILAKKPDDFRFPNPNPRFSDQIFITVRTRNKPRIRRG